eukprot:4066452-Amphidinium_carterae.1
MHKIKHDYSDALKGNKIGICCRNLDNIARTRIVGFAKGSATTTSRLLVTNAGHGTHLDS